jgi:hypothetical protein
MGDEARQLGNELAGEVRRSRDGGQSSKTLSLRHPRHFSLAPLELVLSRQTGDSSTSAPTGRSSPAVRPQASMSRSARHPAGLPSSKTSYVRPPEPGETRRGRSWRSLRVHVCRYSRPFRLRWAFQVDGGRALANAAFWFTMATTVFTAGILARRSRVLLNRKRLLDHCADLPGIPLRSLPLVFAGITRFRSLRLIPGIAQRPACSASAQALPAAPALPPSSSACNLPSLTMAPAAN